MQRRLFLPLAVAAMFCLALAGCGGAGDPGGAITITGRVLLNGSPATNEQVAQIVSTSANTYFGDTLDSSGHFLHSSANGSLDEEFCVAGAVVTLIFNPTHAAADAVKTCVYEYTVHAGDNDMGDIEIGAQGFAPASPVNGAVISSWDAPVAFGWSAYDRGSVAPVYRLAISSSFYAWQSPEVSTNTYSIDGTEQMTFLLDAEPIGGGERNWSVTAEYVENGHTIRHYTAARTITLPPLPPWDMDLDTAVCTDYMNTALALCGTVCRYAETDRLDLASKTMRTSAAAGGMMAEMTDIVWTGPDTDGWYHLAATDVNGCAVDADMRYSSCDGALEFVISMYLDSDEDADTFTGTFAATAGAPVSGELALIWGDAVYSSYSFVCGSLQGHDFAPLGQIYTGVFDHYLTEANGSGGSVTSHHFAHYNTSYVDGAADYIQMGGGAADWYDPPFDGSATQIPFTATLPLAF